MVWASGAALSEVGSVSEDAEEHDPIANAMAMMAASAKMVQIRVEMRLSTSALRVERAEGACFFGIVLRLLRLRIESVERAGRSVRFVGFLGC